MVRITGWVITLLMLGGCTAPRQPAVPAVTPTTPPAPEVVRYDRYLLINTRPDEAQRNPLHQIVNINLPLNLKTHRWQRLRLAAETERLQPLRR
ncbi:type IV B pilus protein [Salmonella enterica subsp. arizonae]|uniref:Type IV B pilus protein n=1 Tax=Salmonella enterica subsp. arizonae TaxID=59203 RepID=A0A379TJT6_SALER|nr:type IV B pilus protein [Salmonella enterica subsp. arizonae]